MSVFDVIGNLISAGTQFFQGDQNRKSQEAMAAQNIALQREFAQSGIQWKVADAQKAGIHPLAALGAQTSSFSPVSVGSTDFGSMGQDLGRAFKAAMSNNDREEADAARAKSLAFEKAGLENDILRTELASLQKRAETNGGAVAMPANTSVFGGRVPIPRAGPDRSVGGQAVSEDDLKQKPEDFPATKVVRPFGYPLYSNPWFNDGQQFEDRYGDSEIGSTVKFGVNTLADHAYTLYRNWPAGASERIRNLHPAYRAYKRFRR